LSVKINIGYVEIEFKVGDITEETADAIVNAANSSLIMGGGVAAAIRNAAGMRVQEEVSAKAPIPIGSAVETSGGSMRARYVIHGALMGMDYRTDYSRITSTMASVMDRAEALGITSIAYPAFGTGVGRFPADQSAEGMLTVLKRYIDSGRTGLTKVVFVLWSEEILEAFESEAKKIFKDIDNKRGKGKA
jgi:O-acetyl-ADP-ribose deacetylase (regulator of RNase III)